MKRVVSFFLLFLLAAIFIRFRSPESPAPPQEIQPGSAQPSNTPAVSLVPESLIIADDVRIDGVFYTVVGKEVLPGSSVSLIANFSDRLSGQRLVEMHTCKTAINGGFYTEDMRPLGWFVSEGSRAGYLIESNLVTGFFWQDREGKRHISQMAPPEEDVDFVLQTGPYINVRNRPLQLISDEPARRSVLGVDADSRLYFLSVIQKENTFSGPLLADLPVLFNNAAVQNAVPFRTLLNLDGGTASFFSGGNSPTPFLLSELKPIGSLLCVQ